MRAATPPLEEGNSTTAGRFVPLRHMAFTACVHFTHTMNTATVLTVWQDRVPFRVHVKGSGPALVYFHGPWGLTWGAFLDALAESFTVYAPEHPGTTPDLLSIQSSRFLFPFQAGARQPDWQRAGT